MDKPVYSTTPKTIILAGATGDLGSRIAVALMQRGAKVIALVRKESSPTSLSKLQAHRVIIREVDFNSIQSIADACIGADCVVSALSGLRDVIVDMQTRLLQAAIQAEVPRFIPSDYCIDYTKLPMGSNRNLDLRREFNKRVDESAIAATSILNGMFADLLTGQAPVILLGMKRVVYWGSAEQLLDFTTIDNTAEYTAEVALDSSTPRYLRIAGDELNVNGLRDAAEAATGEKFKPLRAGGLGVLRTMIKITKTLFPNKKEIFPPWQGMQYLHDMFTGLPKLKSLDNERYPGIQWTSVQDVLTRFLRK